MTPYDALVEHVSPHDAELCLHVLAAAGYILERRPQAREEDVREVWEAYLRYHPRARLDARRRRLIATRLREGHTTTILVAAITGNHRSEYHREHGYHDLGLILRNADLIERFSSSPSDRLGRRWVASDEERAYQASEPEVDPVETAEYARRMVEQLRQRFEGVA